MNFTPEKLLQLRGRTLLLKDGRRVVPKLYPDGWAFLVQGTEILSALDVWAACRWLNDREAQPVGRKICSWCGKILGEIPGLEFDTHGICEECLHKEKALLEQMMKEGEGQE